MNRKYRRFRPGPAMIVALIALFVAMGGVGYSAVKLKKNAVKTKNIKNGAVTTPKLAGGAKAPDAAKLGGVDPSGYQGFCKAGAIKGSIVTPDLTALPATYSTVTGFNCAGGAVQIKKNAPGDYFVRFVGNPGTGSAVVSVASGGRGIYYDRVNDPTISETVFHVAIFNTATFAAVDGGVFTLQAF
jgi:hypothetical protein